MDYQFIIVLGMLLLFMGWLAYVPCNSNKIVTEDDVVANKGSRMKTPSAIVLGALIVIVATVAVNLALKPTKQDNWKLNLPPDGWWEDEKNRNIAELEARINKGKAEIAQCKKEGYKGYISDEKIYSLAYGETDTNLVCSNGETKNGCLLLKGGIRCGNVKYIEFQQSETVR